MIAPRCTPHVLDWCQFFAVLVAIIGGLAWFAGRTNGLTSRVETHVIALEAAAREHWAAELDQSRRVEQRVDALAAEVARHRRGFAAAHPTGDDPTP